MARPLSVIMDDFDRLTCELSPENLCCDGEIPQSEVRRRLAGIQRRWAKLEKELGAKVSEADVYNYFYEKRAS